MMTFSLQVVWITANDEVNKRVFHVSNCDNIGEAVTCIGDEIQTDEAFAGTKDIIVTTEIGD